jgi:hypothetical protein
MYIIFTRCKNTLAYYNVGDVVVNSKVVGWAPDFLAFKNIFFEIQGRAAAAAKKEKDKEDREKQKKLAEDKKKKAQEKVAKVERKR